MATKTTFVAHSFVLLLAAAPLLLTTAMGDPGCPEELERVMQACKEYQTKSLLALKAIFNNEENFPPCPTLDAEIKSKALITAAFTPVDQKKAARVPRPIIHAKVNSSQTFSCGSNGEPLSSCLWRRTVNGRDEVTIVDDIAIAKAGGSTEADRVSFFAHELQEGKCSVRIETSTEAHLGKWSCVLIGDNGNVFDGQVELLKEKEPTIYFTTEGGGLKSYSGETSELRTAVNTTARLFGVTYDFPRDFIYWSTYYKVNRKQRNGSQVTTVLSTEEYGSILALDFDWLTRKLYMGTESGHIVACGTGLVSSSPLACASVFTGQDEVQGVAVHPIQEIMYWTTDGSSSSVKRAGMDGSDVSVIVAGLNYPAGIVIDFQRSRLYWTVAGDSRVQSSDMQGKDVQTVKQLPGGLWTYGIALHANRIYVTNYNSRTLQSFTTAGEDFQELHYDTNSLRHLAIISARPALPTNRTNRCENHGF